MPNARGDLAARLRLPTPGNRRRESWNRKSRTAPENLRAARINLGLWTAYFCCFHSLHGQLELLRWTSLNSLLVEPGLKHQRMPQCYRPIALSGEVFPPSLPQLCGLEESLLPQTRFVQETFGPGTQWAAQPFGNRHGEASLGTFHESRRHILMQNLPQQPFALIPPLLDRRGKAPGEFNHSMIEHRNAGFQTD